MMLSDKDIREYIDSGKLVIEPELKPDQFQPAWLDLTLSNEFKTFKHIDSACLDPKNLKDHTELIRIDDGKSFILHPGEFVLAMVNEYTKLPDDLAGAVDGRSSLGRLGIVVHVTSTFVNPGWGGKLVLEMTNVGKMPVAIYPGMRICKLVFFKLSSPSQKPYDQKEDAKYNDQREIRQSRLDKEFDGLEKDI